MGNVILNAEYPERSEYICISETPERRTAVLSLPLLGEKACAAIPMKTLIVDDDPLQRQLLCASLGREGHDVIEAADGVQAWDLLQRDSGNIPLVITDWMMPELDGLELIQRIRSANFSHYTYIIIVTAKDSKEDVVVGLDSGADDYLVKPFDPKEMRSRVAIGRRILSLETRLRESLSQLHIMATYDSLTNLFNRRVVYERAQVELERARRDKQPLSLVLLDIDHFKDVNDQHGHLIGDQALRMVANTISQGKRPYDLAGRWGGEEFILVLPTTSLDTARLISERIRERVAALCYTLPDATCLSLRISSGVSSTEANEEEVTLGSLIQQADDALYHAKEHGRNRVSVYSVDFIEEGEKYHRM